MYICVQSLRKILHLCFLQCLILFNVCLRLFGEISGCNKLHCQKKEKGPSETLAY